MDLECSSKNSDYEEQELQTSSSTEDDTSERTQNSNVVQGMPFTNIPQQSPLDVSSNSPTRGVISNGGGCFLPHLSTQNDIKTEGSIAIEDDKKREHKRRSKNWARAETLKLIEMRKEFDERFQRSGKKAILWDDIATALQKDMFFRDGQQCKDKWEKLTAAYKEVRDGTRDKSEHPFFDELNAVRSWKAYKKEADEITEACDAKRVKFELNSSPAFLGWNQGGIPYPSNCHLPNVGMMEVEFEGGFPSLDRKDARQGFRENSRDVNEAHRQFSSTPKKKKREEVLYSLDCGAVQELVDSIMTQQQNFVKDLLDALDKKEQLKEQLRHERERRWREEERAQRFLFNSAMIRLTQKLLGETAPAMEVVPSHIMGMPTGVMSPKKRSKNWKKSEVMNLILVRQEMETKFLMSTRRAALWDELGEKLDALGTHRDGKQCREKWDKLMAEYKDVMDGRKQKDESAYFEQLSAFMATPKDGYSKMLPEMTVAKDNAYEKPAVPEGVGKTNH